MSFIELFTKRIEEVRPILNKIVESGGRPYLVGGSVRDFVMVRELGWEIEAKDIDIEVHGISIESLERILQTFGPVSLVGKKFGVLRLHSVNIDWSLPRRDSVGRKPSVTLEPEITIEEASRRRDVTMNAMMIDLSKPLGASVVDVLIDPYGGCKDIKAKRLRLVDKERFVEDPLRFYRVMQFVGRFEMVPDDELNDVCKTMDVRLSLEGGELARERIYEELKKLLLKSARPSLGFRWVKKIGRLDDLFPELAHLVGVEQRSDYHPERDTFEHTMQSIDAAASWPIDPDGMIKDEHEKFVLMLGVLCHDLGKAEKTDENGHSRGHDIAGVPIAKKFLRRFTWSSILISSVCKLVRYHRMPLVLVEQKSSMKAFKRLAKKLSPEINMQQLYVLAWADVRGRNSEGELPLEKPPGNDEQILQTFLSMARDAQVETGPEQPVLLGRDLLDSVEPGPEMGRLLKKAYDIQIDEGIRDKETLKKRVLLR